MAILGSSAISLFSGSMTAETEVKMKHGDSCSVEAEDKIPRMISDCFIQCKRYCFDKLTKQNSHLLKTSTKIILSINIKYISLYAICFIYETLIHNRPI